MKLPGYEYQTSPSLRAPMPQRASTGTNAIGAAVGDIGGSLSTIGGVQAALERKAEAARDALEAEKIMADMRAKSDEYDETLTDTESPAIQAERKRTVLSEWLTTRVESIGSENSRQVVLGDGIKQVAVYASQARTKALGKVIEGTQAGALAQLRELEARGDEESLRTAHDLIAGLTEGGIFSAEMGENLRARTTAGAVNNAFARIEAIDPALALDRVTRGEGLFAPGYLDDANRERLRGVASRTLQARETQERAAQEWADKQSEKLLKEAWNTNESKLRYRLLGRDFTALGDIQKMGWSGSRELSEEGERRLLADFERIRKEKPDTPSDGPTKTRAILLSRSAGVSQKDRDQLAEWFQSGALNSTDYTAADNEAQSTINRRTEKGESFESRRHAQAEQELRAKLGIPTIYDRLNPVKERVFAAALQELTDRSSYIGRGKEDPISAVREMMPRYQSLLLTDTELSLEQKAIAARYKTPRDLESAYRNGVIDKSTYDAQRQVLLDVESVVRDLMKGTGATQSAPAPAATTRNTIGTRKR